MMMRADVKCYYCGFVSGQIEGEPDSTRPQWNFRIRPGVPQPAEQHSRQIRCVRCGGPVFLDEMETVRANGRATQPELATISG